MQFIGKGLHFFNGTYKNTFSAFAYGSAVGFSLFFMPYVGALMQLVGLVVVVLALKVQQKTSTIKAFVPLLPILAVDVLVYTPTGFLSQLHL